MRDQACDCNHPVAQHDDQRWQCRGLDSYGCPCTCPSVETFLWDANDWWGNDYE